MSRVAFRGLMTESDLLDLLLALLAKRTGLSRGHWRRTLGPVKRYARSTHPHCNWSIEPSGAVADVALAQDVLDQVRADHPHID